MPPQTALSKQIFLSIAALAAIVVIGFMLTRPAASISENRQLPMPDPGNVSITKIGGEVTQIKTALVHNEPVDGYLKATGQVLFSSDKTIKISPRIQGRVKEVFVRVGDHVAKGQTLATLDSIDASNARNTLRQAQNRLRLAKAVMDRQRRLFKLGTPEVASAQANLDQAKVNAEFKNEVLRRSQEQASIGGFTQKPLEDAQNALVGAHSDLAQAQADLALAEKDLVRKAKLVEIGVIAKADYESAENVFQKTKVTVDADKEKTELAGHAVEREKKAYKTNLYADQQVRAAQSDFRQGQIQAQAARRSLELAKTSILRDLEQAKSDAETAQADTDNALRTLQLLGAPEMDGSVRVLSPINGVVTDRQVSPGQVVDQSQMTPWQMFVISDTSTVTVESDIYEKDIASISQGIPLKITIAAYPSRTFQGRIKRIAPTLDSKSRSVKVRCEVDNRNGLLRDGMYAEVEVQLSHGRMALSAPLTAIQHDGDSDYVFVEEHGKYLRRKVSLGAQRSKSAIIQKGLQDGEHIVIEGAIYLNSQLSGG